MFAATILANQGPGDDSLSFAFRWQWNSGRVSPGCGTRNAIEPYAPRKREAGSNVPAFLHRSIFVRQGIQKHERNALNPVSQSSNGIRVSVTG